MKRRTLTRRFLDLLGVPPPERRREIGAILRGAPAIVVKDVTTFLTSTGCAFIVVAVGLLLVVGYLVYLIWLFGRELF